MDIAADSVRGGGGCIAPPALLITTTPSAERSLYPAGRAWIGLPLDDHMHMRRWRNGQTHDTATRGARAPRSRLRLVPRHLAARKQSLQMARVCDLPPDQAASFLALRMGVSWLCATHTAWLAHGFVASPLTPSSRRIVGTCVRPYSVLPLLLLSFHLGVSANDATTHSLMLPT